MSRFSVVYISISRGVGIGCLLFITHWLYTSASIVPRWALIPAFPANLFIIGAMFLGCIIASVSDIFVSAIGPSLVLISAVLMSFVPSASHVIASIIVVIAGIVIALIIPSLWRACFGLFNDGTGHVSTGVSYVIAAFLYTSQVTFLFCMTASSFIFSPNSIVEKIFREKPQIPLLISACFLYLAVGKKLFMKPNLVRVKSKFSNTKVLSAKVVMLIFAIAMITIVPTVVYSVVKLQTAVPPLKDSKF